MVFTIVNLILIAFYGTETYIVDRIESIFDDGTNPFIVNLLMITVVTVMYSVIGVCHNFILPSLFTFMMKFCYLFEGCLLINIAFCFTYYGWRYTNAYSLILKWALYIFVAYLTLFKFQDIRINSEVGIQIKSAYLFSSDKTRWYFPWTWSTVYNALYKGILPGLCCVAMLTKNEISGTQLDKFKGYLYSMALLLLWLCMYLFNKSLSMKAEFASIYYVVYLPFMVMMPVTSRIISVTSGKAIMSFCVKALSLYFLPAFCVGLIFKAIYPVVFKHPEMFVAIGFVSSMFIYGTLHYIALIISHTRYSHTSDYAQTFEKDLATIDYSGEMDEIAEGMFKIFNKNVEASSLSVYINVGNGSFETAYTSNNNRQKFEEYQVLFEALLNINKNIVSYFETETEHILAPLKKDLQDFFKNTKSDALFLLNEGRDIHGLIILGKKESDDHYKSYDMNVFQKLYSYFFVFGYYMRNISNKEIIGTVNRELRMSSQIITSIQENIDPVKNPRVDAGCIMVPAHNIGGEFVDMIRLTDTRHLFVIGDLSGKGIAASMSMVILKSIIRAYLAETKDFKQLVVKINRFIRYNLQKGTIFAGMFAILNFENDTMYYINCGIPSILLYTEAYNNVIEIQGAGHILGFVDDISPYIQIKQMKLSKNDIVMACTDGLIESHSLRGEQFGKDRIMHNLVSNSMYPANRMAQFEYDELVKFMSHEMEDDVSVLVIKYLSTIESEAQETSSSKKDLKESLEQYNNNFASDEVV